MDSNDSDVKKANTKKQKRDEEHLYTLGDAMKDLIALSKKSDKMIASKFDRANDAILKLGQIFLQAFNRTKAH